MQNLPKKNFFGGVIGDYYPDITPCRRLQKLLNNTFESIQNELEYNITRVFLDITAQEINQITKKKDANTPTSAYELKNL